METANFNDSLTEIENCFACDAVNGVYSDSIQNIPLLDTGKEFIFPAIGAGIGQNTDDYCIVCPPVHKRSFAHLPPERLARFACLFESIKSTTHKKYGNNILIYETGKGYDEPFNSKAFSHAHTQIFTNIDPEQILWYINEILKKEENLKPMQKIDYAEELPNYKYQRYGGLWVGDEFYITTENFKPRFLREHLCDLADKKPELADYRKHKSVKNVQKTILNVGPLIPKLKKDFNQRLIAAGLDTY